MAEGTEFQTFQEMVSVLALNTPHALVLDWWRRLDRAIDYYFHARGLRRPSLATAAEQVLASDPQVGPEVAVQVGNLRRLRNAVAHEDTKPISPDEAAWYAATSLDLVGRIATDPSTSAPDGGSGRHIA